MEIVIDTTRLDQFFSLPPDQMLWVFFLNIGWMILAVIYLVGFAQFYLMYIRARWARENLRFVILAIDVPKSNVQTPKATENLFTYLGGAHGSVNFFEKWFEGQFQLSFSFETVSLEGYTQFLIRTPLQFRNLVETAVYSQYPDAEITEVDDYVSLVPHRYPDDEYDIWGTEFIQSAPWQYPIKMYRDFEYISGPSEFQFKDPIALLMDLNSSLGPGEYLFFQIVVIPMGFDWIKESENEAQKIIGRKIGKSGGEGFNEALSNIPDEIFNAMSDASEQIVPLWGDVKTTEDKSKKEDRPPSLIDLTPRQRHRLEAVQEKASKLGFGAKFRLVYVAKKEVMNKAKVANGFVGYMKQFSALDLNSFKPDLSYTMTKTNYFAKEPRLNRRKNNIITNYINRDDFAGREPGVYNIEELATVWHFPIEASVRAPLIQKAPGRKADAPASLPLAPEFSRSINNELSADLFSDEKNNNQQSDFEADMEINNQQSLNSVKPDSPLSLDDKNNNQLPDNLPFAS